MLTRAAAAATLLAPPGAWACAVCGQGQGDQGSAAYLFMTIIMSLLPLAAIGGVVGWLALRVRAHRRAEALAQAAATRGGEAVVAASAPTDADGHLPPAPDFSGLGAPPAPGPARP